MGGAEAEALGARDHILRDFLLGKETGYRIVERCARQVVGFRFYRFSRDDQDDLVAQTVADVWRAVSKPGFALRESLPALVRTIAYRRCIGLLREQRDQVLLGDDVLSAMPIDGHPDVHIDEWIRSKVRGELRHLSRNCQQLLQLRFYDGYDRTQIADRFGKTAANIGVQIHNCIKRLGERVRRWHR